MARTKATVLSSPRSVGRASRWNKAQCKAINDTLPDWHTFSIDIHGNLEGNHSTLTDWKKRRADALLGRAEFQILPDGVSFASVLLSFEYTHLGFSFQMELAEARKALLRKWTNYRHTRLEATSDPSAPQAAALKMAAAALCDLKTYSKGKSFFKEQNETKIKERQTQILGQNPDMSQIGAYQVALKELWRQEDQESWEVKAGASTEDVFR